MADKQEHQQQHSCPHGGHHFLVVAYGMQSHVNPGHALAHRLTRLSYIDGRSILATLSVPVAGQRRMFPSPDGSGGGAEEETCSDGVISYVPHSDGFDDGASGPKTAEDWVHRRRVTAESLSAIVARLAVAGKPVTCIVFTMVGPTIVDVARTHGITFAVYWIQLDMQTGSDMFSNTAGS